MRILAIDTATEGCSVAMLCGESVIARYMEMPRGHAERILPMVDEVLAEAGVSLQQLDAIAFGRGPGGFTGVRLAASVTQGLAFGAQVPVLPISDLRALAQQVLDAHTDARTVLVCNDARMQEVYWAPFERNAAGLATLQGSEAVAKPSRVAVPMDLAVPIHGAGRGFRAYPELTDRLRPSLSMIHDTLLPRAVDMLRLAAVDFRAGGAVPPEKALPVYIRDDVARPPSRS